MLEWEEGDVICGGEEDGRAPRGLDGFWWIL